MLDLRQAIMNVLTGGNGVAARSERFRFQNGGYEGLVADTYSERGWRVTEDVKFGIIWMLTWIAIDSISGKVTVL